MIRRVTSQPLGSLPPGYAATKKGYANYAVLVGVLGLITFGIGSVDVWLIIGSIGAFVILSVTAIAGEVATVRKVKR